MRTHVFRGQNSKKKQLPNHDGQGGGATKTSHGRMGWETEEVYIKSVYRPVLEKVDKREVAP